MKNEKTKSIKQMVSYVLQEVRYEQNEMSTSIENESKMEVSSENHQDIQISRFSLSDVS